MKNTGDKEKIIAELKEVKDPELGMDIVSLGLVRSVRTEEDRGIRSAEIVMTLTSPLCPFADVLIEETEEAVRSLGYDDVRVELSFDPPWEPPEDVRALLGA